MILFINSIGGTEIILVMLFILMFFGSKSIPGIARTLGKGMREIQHASNEIRNEIKQTTDQIKKDALIGSELDDTIRTLERRQEETISKINSEIQHVIKPVEKEVNQTIADIETAAPKQEKIDSKDRSEENKQAD